MGQGAEQLCPSAAGLGSGPYQTATGDETSHGTKLEANLVHFPELLCS